MCECLRREDGTWHVDECCAWVMDEYHNGKRPDLTFDEAARIAERVATADDAPYREPERAYLRQRVMMAHRIARAIRAHKDEQEVPF